MADVNSDPKKCATERVKSLVSLFGLIFTIIHFVCFLVSFSTPYWIVHFNKYTERQFVRMGLWEVCFKEWSYFKDYLGKKYNGCWWIYSYEYRPVWAWLNPPWLLGLQILMILSLIMLFIVVLFVILYYCRCTPERKKISYVKWSTILNFTAGIFTAVSITVFGIKADIDRQWLPHPDSNFLSWSFGFGVLSAFFGLFAGMCLLVEYMRLTQQKDHENRRTEITTTKAPKF